MFTRHQAKKQAIAAQTARSKQFPHLPQDLWENIAEMMPTKAWAKASGTCRAFRTIQLQHITLEAPASPEAALAWLASHWSAAETMTLNLEGTVHVRDPLQLAQTAAKQGPAKLPVTRLDIRYNCRSAQWAAWLKWLLKQAPALHFLKLNLARSPDLPRMGHLKHLLLLLDDPSRPLTNALQQLPNLETLLLAGPGHARHRIPDLALPPRLRRLCLITVAPKKLALPNGECTVQVAGAARALEKTLAPLWQCGGPVHRVWTAAITAQDVDFESPDRWFLLGELQGLRQLEISTPPVLQPLEAWQSPPGLCLHCLPQDCCANLTTLILQVAGNLCMTVPHTRALQRVYVNCGNSLCLKFEDVRASAQMLLSFEVFFSYSRRMKPLLKLKECLPQYGGRLIREVLDGDQGRHILMWPPRDGHLWEPHCLCGCCLECIERQKKNITCVSSGRCEGCGSKEDQDLGMYDGQESWAGSDLSEAESSEAESSDSESDDESEDDSDLDSDGSCLIS